MDDNRELGLPLTTDQEQTVDLIGSTFASDFSSTTNTTRLHKSNPNNIPAAWNQASSAAASDVATADGSPNALQRLSAPVGACGPVATN